MRGTDDGQDNVDDSAKDNEEDMWDHLDVLAKHLECQSKRVHVRDVCQRVISLAPEPRERHESTNCFRQCSK